MMQHLENIPGPPLSWIALPLPDATEQAIRELEDVKRVSASLFPRNLPQIGGLECAAVCIEARQAGGDYYDFFDRGPHRLGFAIGDVSGKGVASAIVRATLQASLRTLSTTGWTDLGQTLAVVNRLLFESVPEEMYATLFLAEYDERSRRLRYVNCGHPAPIVYGRNGLSRLQPNATVLGLFDDWECSITEVQLAPGDLVLLYTDGASEAMNDSGEQFGEDRLVELLQRNNHLPLPAFLQKCVDQARGFGSESERDDLTLVALRCFACV
jgi:serine phosphatase RsbU (regulator of sigma subunit)